MWRAVAIPTEHGGWGLTLEPVLLGLLVAFSAAGVAIGVAAFGAFLVRTPLKVALVDRRRQRSLGRSRLAARIAVGELALIATMASAALLAGGWSWLLPIAVATPFVGVELWFDVRSRSRRLIPELCGAVGISAVAASIVLAGDGGARLAAAVWLILGARGFASIPFVRSQIQQLHHGPVSLAGTDAFQVAGAALALSAVAVDDRVVAGSVAVMLLAVPQARWSRRRDVPAAKVIGVRQMAFGLAVTIATAFGVFAS